MNGLNDINTKLVCKLCTTMLRDVKSKTQTLKVSKLSPVRNIVYIDVYLYPTDFVIIRIVHKEHSTRKV